MVAPVEEVLFQTGELEAAYSARWALVIMAARL